LAAAADSLESSKAASRTDVFDYIESLLLIDGAPRLEERDGHALQKCRWRGKNGKELRSFGFAQPFGRQRKWLNDAR
jgi:hypothetical protein